MRAPTELWCRAQLSVGPLVVTPLTCLRGWAPHSAGCSQTPTAAAAAAASFQRRSVWGEAAPHEEVLHRDSFYDTVVETWAAKVSGAVRQTGFSVSCSQSLADIHASSTATLR